MGIPAKVWVPDIGEVEPQALEQIKKMGAIAGAVGWLAIMPDVHLGKGAVVGGVVATKGIVVPNIVGVDIGCGMCAVDTGVVWDRRKMDKRFWQEWGARVERRGPTGFGRHKQQQA